MINLVASVTNNNKILSLSLSLSFIHLYIFLSRTLCLTDSRESERFTKSERFEAFTERNHGTLTVKQRNMVASLVKQLKSQEKYSIRIKGSSQPELPRLPVSCLRVFNGIKVNRGIYDDWKLLTWRRPIYF